MDQDYSGLWLDDDSELLRIDQGGYLFEVFVDAVMPWSPATSEMSGDIFLLKRPAGATAPAGQP